MATVEAPVQRLDGVGRFAFVHPATALLIVSMFTTGFSGLVNEYALATTATYIMGNSVYQWSLIIAVMMAMMGIGAWAQKAFNDHNLVEKFACIEILLALAGGFAPLINYWVFAYNPEWYSFSSLGLAAVIGLLIGFELPLVMRINERYSDSLKENASSIFGADYVGSFVGALIWIFWLLPNYPLTELSFIVSGTNFLVAVMTVLYFWSKGTLQRWSVITGSVLLLATGAALVWGYCNNRDWSVRLEQKFFDARVIHSETSKFQHIVFTEHAKLGNYELFLNGKKQFASLDEHIYHEMLVHPAMALHDNPKRVLILGGGDGFAVREVLKYPTVETVTLVDLDPAMVEFASQHPVMKRLNENAFGNAKVSIVKDPAVVAEELISEDVYMHTDEYDENGAPKAEKVASVQVMHIDASVFVDAISDTFDVIIIDFPDPGSAALVKLYSKQVFAKVRNRLSPNGLLSIQATSPYHAKDAYLTIGNTMRAAGLGAIPYHENVPSFGEWGWFLGSVGNDKRTKLIHAKIESLESFPVETQYVTPDLFRASLVFGRGWLESERAGVNTLADPVLLPLYLDYAWRVE